MYDGILHKPLRLRPNITPAARSFLEGLLQKDKTHRLGSGPGDYNDIMRHSFFRSINWEDLYNKRIEPPFNPNVAGKCICLSINLFVYLSVYISIYLFMYVSIYQQVI